jgi:16S rRNA (adenine1518-N6/adenine1519-N6)-dimethyltransferase
VPFISPKILCRHHKLTPKKSLGQNFLLHPDQARRLVAALDLDGQETVVEIGAGLGALTFFLAQAAGQVVALEMDHRLPPILQEEVLVGLSNVQIVSQDALHFDFLALSRASGLPLSVIGNLPYQITSPLLFKLLGEKTAVKVMVLMMQQEVGQRLLAPPGGKDYGILSVLLQYHFRLERLFSLGPNNFYPAPKVDSVVLRLHPRLPELPVVDEELLKQVVKAAFATRRKTLKNSLSAQASRFGHTPATLLDLLHALGLDPGRRPETLSVLEFVRLTNALRQPVA